METKICNKCGLEKPATKEFFGIARRNIGGLRCVCKQCEIIERKIYKTKNKEVIKTKNKIYRDTNKEILKEKNQIYRDNHKKLKDIPAKKEKICRVCKLTIPADDDTYFYKKDKGKYGLGTICRDCFKKYSSCHYLKNKESITEKNKQYYKNNIEKSKKYSKSFHLIYDKTEKGKDVKAVAWQKRRTLELDLGGSLSKEQWADIKNYFNMRCAYCGEDKKLTIEHFIPVSKGGTLSINNIIPSCGNCNSSKGNRDFNQWYKNQPYYSKEREENILTYLDMVIENDNQIDESAS